MYTHICMCVCVYIYIYIYDNRMIYCYILLWYIKGHGTSVDDEDDDEDDGKDEAPCSYAQSPY